jgi:hypothetical protein
MSRVTHRPGRHCASTAIADVSRFHGLNWSEAFCFGLGGGLGLFYLEMPRGSPSRLLHVRSADFESNFFARLGHRFQWRQFNDPKSGEGALWEMLDAGHPALVQTDLYYLPYYDSHTHFPGHLIVVWDYDAQRQIYRVTDTERPHVLELPREALAAARFSREGPFPLSGQFYAPESMTIPEDLPARLHAAILANSASLLSGRASFQGLAALARWQADLPRWPKIADWQWTARFAYQIIEKRGTGGGAFRLLYADFLSEAVAWLPGIDDLDLAPRMRQVAGCWSDLASALKVAAEADLPAFEEVAQLIERVRQSEQSWHEMALHLPSPDGQPADF